MTWRYVLGTTDRAGPPAHRRSTRPLRDCLRQRRLLDLLRARPGGGTRTRPDAAPLHLAWAPAPPSLCRRGPRPPPRPAPVWGGGPPPPRPAPRVLGGGGAFCRGPRK